MNRKARKQIAEIAERLVKLVALDAPDGVLTNEIALLADIVNLDKKRPKKKITCFVSTR